MPVPLLPKLTFIQSGGKISLVLRGAKRMPSREQLNLGAIRHETLNVVEHINNVSAIRGDHRHAQLCSAVQIEVPHLGNTHLKLPADLSNDRPHY